MKPRYKMAGGMLLLVVLAGAVSAAVFVLVGSQEAVYAQLGLVPLLLLLGYVWVNQTVKSTGTSRAEFERRKARTVGEKMSDLWQLTRQISQEYDEGIQSSDWEVLNNRISDLESSGIAFDTETASFDISSSNLGTLEEINRLETELEDAREEVLTRFADNAREAIIDVNAALERLGTLLDRTEAMSPSAVPDPDSETTWTDIGEILDNCHREANSLIDEACEEVQAALTSTDDTAAVDRTEELLSTARKASDEHRYHDAATALLDARDAVERDAADAFADRQASLERLVRSIEETAYGEYVSDQYGNNVDEYSREVEVLSDALDITELRSLESEVRDLCLEIVSELQETLQADVDTLEAAETPAGWYQRPDCVNTAHVDQLEREHDLDAFRNAWCEIVETLVEALDDVDSKAEVVSGYDRIEDRIEKAIRSSGQVTAADLPVSELEEQFLGLYYRQNMDSVEFDPAEPSLTASGGGETHTVTVTVSFPMGGQQREVTVVLTGDGYDSRETSSTPLATTVTFEDVPYGEYAIRAETSADGYSAVTDDITVDGELELEYELREISLQERLCVDVDVDVADVLAQLGSKFETRFEEDGYLSTSMDFPVDSEYVPCLLVTWANRNGYDVADGETVLIFERDQLQKEVENVIRYNLDSGERKTFDQLRSNFLSAPVPDSTVVSLVEESSEAGAVDIDGEQLTKTDTE